MTARLASLVFLSATALGLLAPSAHAQSTGAPQQRWEFILSSGRFLPVGDDRNRLTDADQSTATLTRLLTPRFGVTASAGWGRSRELITLDRTRTNVFTYDVGAEWRASPHFVRQTVFLRPLAGAGLGARTYDRRGISNDASSGVAAFVAVGAEAGIRRVRVRLELRDYVSNAALMRGSGQGRNDLAVLFGLRLAKP